MAPADDPSTHPLVSRGRQLPNRRGDAFLDAIVRRLARIGSLTPRMTEAVALHVRGWPPDAASRQMRCSHNTYRNHLATALRRIGADSASELLRIVANDLDRHPVALEFEPSEGSN